METLKDYVRFISESMDMELTSRQRYDITMWLLQNDHYNKMLQELEGKIIDAANDDGKVVSFRSLSSYYSKE